MGRVLSDQQEILSQNTPTDTWVSLFTANVDSDYDVMGSVTETRSSWGATSTQLRINRTYDPIGRLLSVADTSGSANIPVASYDWRGARGRVQTLHHPWNGTRTQYNDYDLRGRVGQIVTKWSTSGFVLAGREYGYEPSGAKKYELKRGPGGYELDDHVYTHDPLDRLAKFEQGEFDPTAAGGQGAFVGTATAEILGMDGAGSIRQHTVPGVGSPYANGTDSTNSYTPIFNSTSNEWEGSFDGLTVDRDHRGNTITLGVMNLSYDVYGHVVGTMRPYVSPIVPTLEFRDAFNRRVYRDYNGEKRAFVFQGEELLQEIVLNPSSGPIPVVRKEYFHGAGIDETVMQRVVSTAGAIANYAMHTDTMGTPYAATNASGTLSELYDIGPYGEYSATDVDGGGTFGNRIGLAGMWYDSVTNLYFMRARHYSPFLKRFLSRDPLGAWRDMFGRGNGYGYCGFSPTRLLDPTGLLAILDDAVEFTKDALSAAGSAVADAAEAAAQTAAATAQVVGDVVGDALGAGLNGGASGLGSAGRNIPLVGGMVGAAGDMVAGAVNFTAGVASFGGSGTLQTGITQLADGATEAADILARDALGVATGAAGTVYTTAMDVANVATLGQLDALGSPSDVNMPRDATGLVGALARAAGDAIIPDYGMWGGASWGSDVLGSVPRLFVNQFDVASYNHDITLDHGAWLSDCYSTSPSAQWMGPVGAAITLVGTPVFAAGACLQQNGIIGPPKRRRP